MSFQRLGYELDERVSAPGWGNDEILSLRHRAQNDSGTHPASYPIDTEGT